MAKHAVIDPSGEIVNAIELDENSQWEPPEGHTVRAWKRDDELKGEAPDPVADELEAAAADVPEEGEIPPEVSERALRALLRSELRGR